MLDSLSWIFWTVFGFGSLVILFLAAIGAHFIWGASKFATLYALANMKALALEKAKPSVKDAFEEKEDGSEGDSPTKK